MGGVVDSIFGGGSTESTQRSSQRSQQQSVGAQAGSQSSTPVDLTPEQFESLRGPLAQALQSQIQSGGGPQFQGDFAAQLGGGENAFLQAIQQQGLNPSAANQASGNFLQSMLQGAGQGAISDAIQSAQQSVINQFNEETLPGLRAQFARAGQQIQGDRGSSPFQMAQARASSGLADALGGVSSDITLQGINQQLQAANQAQGLDQARMENLMAGLEASALPRMVEQLGIDRGLEEFRRRQDQLLQVLGAAGQLSSPVLGQESEGKQGGFQTSTGSSSSTSRGTQSGSKSSGGLGEAIGAGLSYLL